jgi:hypothetical protein
MPKTTSPPAQGTAKQDPPPGHVPDLARARRRARVLAQLAAGRRRRALIRRPG